MPRIKRRGFNRREDERPLNEWTVRELKAEVKRLKASPDPNPWKALKRNAELENELDHRRTI